jgi:hypothetical protein
MTTTAMWVPDPDVVHTALPHGEGVLLHLETSQYYSLNETGNCIWQWLTEGETVEAIGQKLVDRYEVTLDRAQHCVADLVTDLAQEKLLEWQQ